MTADIGSALPNINDIVAGKAVFPDDMPVWLATFGAEIWPFVAPSSPLFSGYGTCSFIWPDYIAGRGATLQHPGSFHKAKYDTCLTAEIVQDLKVAAVIHGYFPKLIKNARSTKAKLDGSTVKGRIEELARFFSLVIQEGLRTRGLSITRLDQIPFALIKESIPKYPGRSAHLKRALKLISDPMVQQNLSAPLQWSFLDITKSSLAWRDIPDEGGIPTLSDRQFLFLLDRCKRAIARFKRAAQLEIHDSECRMLAVSDSNACIHASPEILDAYYTDRQEPRRVFFEKHGLTATDVADLIRDAHLSALLLILLFTGMRLSETRFLMRGSLVSEHGYWFLKSKVVKSRPKEVPCVEGWLAIDITRDAYDVLSFACDRTGNDHLFSTPFIGFAKSGKGYSGGSLNTKFSRWIKHNDTDGVFSGWSFSVHQCRETLVFQMAKQDVGMPFISMQLKHFRSQFNSMPNAVTAGYGQYRSQLLAGVANRIADARESALLDVYGEDARFAGGGGDKHKARIDAFFSGLGLFGQSRVEYIKALARRGAKLMPTSIGNCMKNFLGYAEEAPPPCYGDYHCDPDCHSHVITDRCALALMARRQHALAEAQREINADAKGIWLGLIERLNRHIIKLKPELADA